MVNNEITSCRSSMNGYAYYLAILANLPETFLPESNAPPQYVNLSRRSNVDALLFKLPQDAECKNLGMCAKFQMRRAVRLLQYFGTEKN